MDFAEALSQRGRRHTEGRASKSGEVAPAGLDAALQRLRPATPTQRTSRRLRQPQRFPGRTRKHAFETARKHRTPVGKSRNHAAAAGALGAIWSAAAETPLWIEHGRAATPTGQARECDPKRRLRRRTPKAPPRHAESTDFPRTSRPELRMMSTEGSGVRNFLIPPTESQAAKVSDAFVPRGRALPPTCRASRTGSPRRRG